MPVGGAFTLQELQTLVGGYIEVVTTVDGGLMVLDEEGKLKGKPVNPVASALYVYGSRDRVVGEAILVTREEMGETDDEEEDEED